MKSFSELLEQVRPCPTPSPDHKVTDEEAKGLIKKFTKVFDVLKLDFSFSHHALVDRMNHVRNKPPISACEFEYVLTKFIQKMSKQLQDDQYDVEKGFVTARGKRKEDIRAGSYEYGITSRSTGLAIILAVSRSRGRGRHKAGINIITVMRKHGFGVNKGEHIMVEGKQYDYDEARWVTVD